MMKRIFSFSRLILLAFAMLACDAAVGVGPKVPIPVSPARSPGPVGLGPQDSAPDIRNAASRDRFGAYRSESDKQSLMRSLQTQAALFGNLLPGGSAPADAPRWKLIGPSNDKYEWNFVKLKVKDSGRVRTILQSPSDPDTVYVLTSGGGLWRTGNFSDVAPKWKPLTDALQTTSGGSVAFGRTAGVLYLGLGDPFDGFPTLGGVVVKSTDGGNTWSPFVSLTGAFTVSDLKVDSSRAVDVILAATDAGIYRSADAGASFSQVAAVVGQQFWSLAKTSAGWIATAAVYGPGGTTPGQMLYSTDQGASWRPIPNPGNGYSNAGRTTLAVAQPGESTVYAEAANVDGVALHDLFKSQDGGMSWVALGIAAKTPANPNTDQPDMNLMGFQGWYDQMILVDPTDRTRNTVYLGGELSTAKTTDGGNSWMLLSNWLPGGWPDTASFPYVHADHHAAAAVNLKGRSAIVFGTDGGIFVTADGGATFDSRKNEGIVSFLAQTVSSSNKKPKDVITGMQDDGTRARLGASSTFNQVFGGDGEGVGWSQANNARTVLSTQYGLCFVNGLLPNTIIDYNASSILCWGSDIFYVPVATPNSLADPTGLVFFSADLEGPTFTTDGGYSLYYLAYQGYNGLPGNFVVRPVWHALGIDPSPALNRFAVGGTGGRLAISLDGANSWNVVSLNSYGFTSFVSSPAWTSTGILYVASESPITGSVRVLRSTNAGASFTRADNGLPDAGVYHLVVDPADPNGDSIYAATYLGVYKSRDGGQHWARFGAGLPAVRATGLWVSEDGSRLRVATYGRGIWEIDTANGRE